MEYNLVSLPVSFLLLRYSVLCSIESLSLVYLLFMSPTLKNLKVHIALGLSARSFVRPSVRYKFKIGFSNFIDGLSIKNN